MPTEQYLPEHKNPVEERPEQVIAPGKNMSDSGIRAMQGIKPEKPKSNEANAQLPDQSGATVKNDYADPRHEKGAVLEGAHRSIIESNPDCIILSNHDRVTEPGFDLAYFDKKQGKLHIVEAKNYGSPEKPGYVGNISAFQPDHYTNNIDKLLAQNRDLGLDAKTRVKIEEAVFSGNEERDLVIGKDTRISDNRRQQFDLARTIKLDPADLSALEVKESAKQ